MHYPTDRSFDPFPGPPQTSWPHFWPSQSPAAAQQPAAAHIRGAGVVQVRTVIPQHLIHKVGMLQPGLAGLAVALTCWTASEALLIVIAERTSGTGDVSIDHGANRGFVVQTQVRVHECCSCMNACARLVPAGWCRMCLAYLI